MPLERPETGRLEPVSDREMLYPQLFEAGRRPDRNDVIVSKPRLQLDTVLVNLDSDAADDDPPFTPTPEPAIPTP